MSQSDSKDHGQVPALVLPGGGARAAYQVGVMRAVHEFLGKPAAPFPIICGTSAGAINAAVLASHADEFDVGVERLHHFWSNMVCERIYRTDAAAVLKSGLHWLAMLASGGWLGSQPRSLLDSDPLARFLSQSLKLDGVERSIQNNSLRGLAITASAYTQARAVSFFQGNEKLQPWQRSRRTGERAEIGIPHLMASAALPLIFPAQAIGNEYNGDGGMRMVAPLSPAIHLGAQKILVIATRDENPDPPPEKPVQYPSLGEVGGYLLDTIFMDTLNADLARLQRINQTLALIDPQVQHETSLRHIETLVIRPSRDLRDLTREHTNSIPRSVRMLLRTLGGWGRDWRMASYLLFESAYCNELMELGYSDGMKQREEISALLLT